ncbi:MAG: ABC transporter ATP-binding protein, partial [Anaerolineae bacterium]|nr:ABC transporter ATP-binding protein [Anaerolineae bacterium]
SLTIEAGTTHSIIGPNGAGKTTFFNLLTGKYHPTRGTVIYKGQDITHQPVHRRAHLGIGRSFQITNIFPNLTVLENVRLATQAMGKNRFQMFRLASAYPAYTTKALEVLELVGLREAAFSLASVLPHGGKRKLELAILLAADPEILLLDEPTAGMASEQVPELMQTIALVQQQGGAQAKTIVLVEHNMNVVMSISDKITVMNLGSVLAEGTPAEISTNENVQKVYLGELYDLSGVH